MNQLFEKTKNLKKKSMKLFRGKGETNKHPHPSNHHYPTTSKKLQKKNAAKVLEYIPSLAPPTAWSYLQAQTEGPRWSPVTMGSEVVVWSTGLPGVTKTKEYVLLFFLALFASVINSGLDDFLLKYEFKKSNYEFNQ